VGFDQLNRQMKAKAEEWIRRESGPWLAEVTAHCSFRLVPHTAISLHIFGPGVPILQVCNGGESIRVNSLQGDGVSELRQGLKAFVHQMPWYPEPLPKSWIEFRRKLRDLQEKKYVDWKSDYLPLAQSCELKGAMLKSATRFLHDTGSIRCFNDDYESGLVYLST
jgi:hypothetical protein